MPAPDGPDPSLVSSAAGRALVFFLSWPWPPSISPLLPQSPPIKSYNSARITYTFGASLGKKLAGTAILHVRSSPNRFLRGSVLPQAAVSPPEPVSSAVHCVRFLPSAARTSERRPASPFATRSRSLVVLGPDPARESIASLSPSRRLAASEGLRRESSTSSMAIECLVLGAGQEVGKSCVVVSIGGKRIMFDCGMHMGYLDHRRFPDFSLISETGDFNSALTCVVITHFHLDHVGALPYFTEVCGYHGPIYMTYPTKALAPLMLEDYRKVIVDRRGEEELFTYDHIMECMKKVTPLDIKQTIRVDKDLEIRAYYAGHVLGAAMIYAKVGENTILYTGDYNMTPDRHLGAAQIDRLQLDLVITESTYATTIRDSKYAREREFLKAVHKCVAGGGKVLIPTFALGRAQELCILLDDYWERMKLKVPIYFSAGLTIQANMYYKMFIGWASQKIKDTSSVRNTYDFKHVCPLDRSLVNAPGPCVLFATPGMISGGFSLEVFKQWAPSELNLVTLPGYCVAGTIGHKLMSGKPTKVDLDKETQIDVRCQIHQLSFSPHTDAKGIMDLIGFLSPKHVMLVHGEKPKMALLQERIQSELGIPCCHPANNETVLIPTTLSVKVSATKMFIRRCSTSTLGKTDDALLISCSTSNEASAAEGILVMEKTKTAKIIDEDELVHTLGVEEHQVLYAFCCPVEFGTMELATNKANIISFCESSLTEVDVPRGSATTGSSLHDLLVKFSTKIDCKNIQIASDHLQLRSFHVAVCSNEDCQYRMKNQNDIPKSTVYFCCRWSPRDDKFARELLQIMEQLNSSC